jgi:hypothetical protein
LPTNSHFQKEEGLDALRSVLLAYAERNKVPTVAALKP